eukprot:CAMPEP_0114993302 /NCGR_PEP_ID=MMETSP0216-20121206/12451_1 /TAXON_ID=223996 /ORGANISM="Protocruzia adherens, Strain Boccale" /LENGTH=327 /DNA_ID=CAMNT_0002356923 /DNA_START=263 /DNA_END=1246 /DNA_ORIENTATION=-
MGKDLIAFKIINDLDVRCHNDGCKWEGPLCNADKHLETCLYDKERMPEWLKQNMGAEETPDKNISTLTEDEKYVQERMTEIHDEGSLKMRLFNKSEESRGLLEKMLSKEEQNEDDAFMRLVNSAKYDEEDDEEIRQLEAEFGSYKRDSGKKSTTFSKSSNETSEKKSIKRSITTDANFLQGLETKGGEMETDPHSEIPDIDLDSLMNDEFLQQQQEIMKQIKQMKMDSRKNTPQLETSSTKSSCSIMCSSTGSNGDPSDMIVSPLESSTGTKRKIKKSQSGSGNGSTRSRSSARRAQTLVSSTAEEEPVRRTLRVRRGDTDKRRKLN